MFAQGDSELCVAFRAFEEADLELRSLASLVGSSGHFPSFLRRTNLSSTLNTFSHCFLHHQSIEL
jgi:hypothetical protein